MSQCDSCVGVVYSIQSSRDRFFVILEPIGTDACRITDSKSVSLPRREVGLLHDIESAFLTRFDKRPTLMCVQNH